MKPHLRAPDGNLDAQGLAAQQDEMERGREEPLARARREAIAKFGSVFEFDGEFFPSQNCDRNGERS